MVKITGYHGTHRKNASSISTTGFQSSKEDEYLGAGVYFFEDAEFGKGIDEAICFCRFVRFIDRCDIVVFRANVESTKVLDLVSNIEHRKLFDEAKNRLRLALKSTKNVDSKVEDYRIFNLIDRDKSFEVIRAIIEAAREEKEVFSYIIRRPQIQICVKTNKIIKDITIAWRPSVGRYEEWTTG